MPVGNPPPVAPKPPSAKRQFWLVLSDPCGLVCIAITYFVVLFVNFVTVRHIVLPWFFYAPLDSRGKPRGYNVDYRTGLLQIIAFEATIVMIFWSHLKCMLTNPGTLKRLWPQKILDSVTEAVKLRRAEDEQARKAIADGKPSVPARRRTKVQWCSKCDNYKPKHTHHCSYCGTCVENMDHHCPWMNNCVGKRNHKFFMLFLLYVGLGSGYAMCITIMRLVTCFKTRPKPAMAMNCSNSSSLFVIMTLISIIFSLLFMLFVTCMGWEQLAEIGDATNRRVSSVVVRPVRV